VLFVNMFDYDVGLRVSPEVALEGFLRALGVQADEIPSELQDLARLYASVLETYATAGQRVLVIVDNVATAEHARPLLPSDGFNRALVTSRHTLAGLGARLHDLDVLDSAGAVDLLRQVLAQACGADDMKVADDPGSAELIGKLCGWLPLALQIVAFLMSLDISAEVCARPRAVSITQRG
jgi:hypothetical protein